jgi:hypothetical protein
MRIRSYNGVMSVPMDGDFELRCSKKNCREAGVQVATLRDVFIDCNHQDTDDGNCNGIDIAINQETSAFARDFKWKCHGRERNC